MDNSINAQVFDLVGQTAQETNDLLKFRKVMLPKNVSALGLLEEGFDEFR